MAGPTITSSDRLSLTLFLAVVAHALVILGIGFSTGLPKPQREAPLIEITLADNPMELAPEDYEYLAQANQDGGGDNPEKARPRKSGTMTEGDPDGRQQMQAAPAPTPPPQNRQQQIISARDSNALSPRTSDEAAPNQPDTMAMDVINAERQVAKWSAQQEQSDSATAKFPDKRRIDPRTKAHDDAAYIYDWAQKVERIGNLNYPDEARRRNLSGALILEVTLRPDGSIHDLKVLKPSNHPVLDQSALRSVRLAAPFSPVPENVLKGHSLLVITRTFEYLGAGSMSAR